MTMAGRLALLATSAALGAAAAGAALRRRRARERAAWQARLAQAEAAARSAAAQRNDRTAQLWHDLRGALSPALLTTDRLSASDDPAVRKAAQIVIRSISRATQIL